MTRDIEPRRIDPADDLYTYLSVREVAQRLSYTEDTIRRLARQGKLPGSRFGRRWLFSARAIREILNPNERSQENDTTTTERSKDINDSKTRDDDVDSLLC